MTTWEDVSQDPKQRRISSIGETRCVALVHTLFQIHDNARFTAQAPAKARTYMEALLKYETVLTAELFLRIFALTAPLTKYLQTSGMDLLSAHRMVRETHQQLQNFVRDFDAVKEAADKFVNWANSRFKSEDAEVEVMDALPEKHFKKKEGNAGRVC